MTETDKILVKTFISGLKRAQYLAQAGASLNYDEIKEIMNNVMQTFAIKEYSLLKNSLRKDMLKEERIALNKSLFTYLAKITIKIAGMRNSDRKNNQFFSLNINDRMILTAHYILKMEASLIVDILGINADDILESIARSEHVLLNDQSLYTDLSLLATECPKVTKSMAFARGTLEVEKRIGMGEHIKNCELCSKVLKHIKDQEDQLIKFIPTIELETLDINQITTKAVQTFYENQKRSLGTISRQARKILDFFSL